MLCLSCTGFFEYEQRKIWDEFLRVKVPTSHLAGRLRPDGAARGFNLIPLGRSHGLVERVEIDAYDLNKVAQGPEGLERISPVSHPEHGDSLVSGSRLRNRPSNKKGLARNLNSC